MKPKRTQTPRCWRCRISVPGPRTVIAGQWYCSDCTLELELGRELPRVERLPRRRPGEPVQDDRLFDPGPPTPRAA
jgi:hypothetical protein